MTPRTPRWRVAIALFACVMPVLSGCGTSPTAAPQANPTVSAEWVPPSDPTPMEEPEPTPSETVMIPAGAAADYVGRIPKFAPAPPPERIALPHYEGRAAFVNEIPTPHPVAFLTIDDGIVRHPVALDLLRVANVPVTLFLTTNYVAGNQDWFRALRDTGNATIESHTISHPHLPQIGYGDQRYQLCHATDLLEQWYGIRPTFFRPPYGERNDDTLRAAWSCGLQVGFHWRETVDSGNVYYQRTDKKIHAGDIILMHFRPAFPEDFLAALNAIKDAGLTPARLEDYVAVGPATGQPAPQPQPTTQPPLPQPQPQPQPTTAPPTTAPPSTEVPTTNPTTTSA